MRVNSNATTSISLIHAIQLSLFHFETILITLNKKELINWFVSISVSCQGYWKYQGYLEISRVTFTIYNMWIMARNDLIYLNISWIFAYPPIFQNVNFILNNLSSNYLMTSKQIICLLIQKDFFVIHHSRQLLILYTWTLF